jgi:large subunit ribosomal protein L3
MKFVLATKDHMEQRFDGEGNAVAVTIVKVAPCVITQIKTEKTDGYNALQVASGKEKNATKSLKGHFKKATQADSQFKTVNEFRIDKPENFQLGQIIDINTFVQGDDLKVTGISKGKGFQGVVKRHGFHGHPATHGHKDQERMPGSIGAGGFQRVIKGMRMGGRMGNEQITVTGLEFFNVDKDNNLLEITGAVPGHRGTWLKIVADGDLKVALAEEPKVEVEEPVEIEEVKTEDQKTEDKEVEVVAENKETPVEEAKEELTEETKE